MLHYYLHFNEDLSAVNIKFGAGSKGWRPTNMMKLFNNFFFPMFESKKEKYERGEMFHRLSWWVPDYAGKLIPPVNYYYLLRVMDGNLQVSDRNANKALRHISTTIKAFTSLHGFGKFKGTYVCKD